MRNGIGSVIIALFLCTSAAWPQSLDELRTQLEQRVQEWVAAEQWSRPDGYTYAVDVGQLLIYAALRGNEGLYASLREFAIKNLIRDDRSDPYTQGFVIWRYKPDTTPDASGVTEGLRISQGLWIGSQKFGGARDRELALMVARGYAHHSYVDQGVWLIRNYFNLGTRAFATNSFLVNFDADYMNEAGEQTGDEEFKDVATKTYELVSRAVTTAGLIHEIVQPEIATLLPDLNLAVFSPNSVVHLANSCTVAERVVSRDREIGLRVLRFATDRASNLKTYYNSDTGEPISDRNPGPATYACLVRLAVKLGDGALELFQPRLKDQVSGFVNEPYELRLYNASEFLLAMQYALQGPSAGR